MRINVRSELSQIEEVVRELKARSNNIGAIVLFIGLVRGESKGRTVNKLVYEAQESLAENSLRKIVEDVVVRYGLIDAIVEHRVGELSVGDETMIIGVASKHRTEGLLALDEILDRIKAGVPIWKKEITNDGAYWIKDERPKDIQIIIDGMEAEVKDKGKVINFLKDLLGTDLCQDVEGLRIKINIRRAESSHESLS
ncbi:MAG: molybdenum cofactor biosynthesis protein MoaE [Crenarchaeota archaeon]|nr:molybdenum cofactor biosynthesis protein MoaE [Thermoproteota archaeon]